MLAKGGIYFSVYLEKSNSGCKFLKSCEIADIENNCGHCRQLQIADNCGY